jgi:hypothetical protein
MGRARAPPRLEAVRNGSTDSWLSGESSLSKKRLIHLVEPISTQKERPKLADYLPEMKTEREPDKRTGDRMGETVRWRKNMFLPSRNNQL